MKTKCAPCRQAALCSCRTKGRRCSSRKRAVLEALRDSGRHAGAEEALALARKRSPGIGIATVYRALKCLCGCGKAVELRLATGAAVYEAAGQARPRARLVCSRCGAVAGAGSPALERLAAAAAARRGFSPSVLELRGLCAGCRAKAK